MLTQEIGQQAARILSLDSTDVLSVFPLPGSENILFRVELRTRNVVLRLSPVDRRDQAQLRAEMRWLNHLRSFGVKVVQPIALDTATPLQFHDRAYHAVLFDWIDGRPPSIEGIDHSFLQNWGGLLGSIHSATAEFSLYGPAYRQIWHETDNYAIDQWAWDVAPGIRAMMHDILRSAKETLEGPYAIVHGDLGVGNLLRVGDDLVALDFDDACFAPPIYDIGACLFDLLIDSHEALASSPDVAFTQFFKGYRQRCELPRSSEKDISAVWWALLVERVLAARRLRNPAPDADTRLLRAIQSNSLPKPLARLSGSRRVDADLLPPEHGPDGR